MSLLLQHQLMMILTLLALSCVRILAAVQDYVIYPVTTINVQSAAILHSAIVALAEDSSKVYVSTFPGYPPAFWVAPLTPQAVSELEQHPLVEGIQIDKIGGEPFATSQPEALAPRALPHYLTQFTPTATELRVLSQPSGEANLNRYKNYVYASHAGEKFFVYHIETGINADHVEFHGRRGEWVFTDLARRAGEDKKDEAAVTRGHSTCTASKATGNLYGASKYATLVVVKMPDFSDKAMVEALRTAYHHIKQHDRGQRSVITISWGSLRIYNKRMPLDTWGKAMEDALVGLDHAGVIVVCAAGNHAQEYWGRAARTYVDTIPAVFDINSHAPHNRGPVAVGNCNNVGKRYVDSQTTPHAELLHAPGVGARCADAHTRDGSLLWTGTSLSAPLVAGVIAGSLPLLPSGASVWNRRAFVDVELGWTRPGARRVIWNLVDKANNPPSPSVSGGDNTSSLGSPHILSNYSAADWPDTSLPQSSLNWTLTADA